MNNVPSVKSTGAPRLQLFNCTYYDCGATFTRQWRLREHETVHTGARPQQCKFPGCGRRFSRKSHLSRHALQHTGIKKFKCTTVSCTKSFVNADKLKRHVRCVHGERSKYFKCNQPKCSQTFKKRRLFKLHLRQHGVSSTFKCSKDGCGATFDSRIARKAHEKKHAGYRCPHANCQVLEHTWGKLQKHMAKHPATFTCKVCNKVFKKMDSLRRHKRTHASRKPVLLCPRTDCQAYFSTTFNLQHHIRKVHLQLLKHSCPYPECTRTFAMRESMSRHLKTHLLPFDPAIVSLKRTRSRSRKSWQKRLNGHHLPLVEEDLRRLFGLRMRISRRAKVETNLAGLFNERKIPHHVDPEVNLRNLFNLKQPQLVEAKPEAPPVKA
ncbi:P43 5S RNA-binding protein-like [Myripristis murdjan]|uniref:Wilms tumor protein homolog n=1 Tax=Myripristis murdjan TaxID=586833 RepID=A0A667XY92_9TELE|nr:P43 5S RNA-binding protein-like [Myripristis murdjan]